MDIEQNSGTPHNANQYSLLVRLGSAPLPFFAEYPYFVWGEVNYDSDGDCDRPTDTAWHWLELGNRATGERLDIDRPLADTQPGLCSIEATCSETAILAAYLTALRSGGCVLDPTTQQEIMPAAYAHLLPNLEAKLEAVERVRAMFTNPALAPFDSHHWWGGWKWVGRFCTDMTAGLRLTMLAVEEGRAEPDLVEWLHQWWKEGPDAGHRDGVQAALQVLTGRKP